MKRIFNLFKEWKNIQFNDNQRMAGNDFENKTLEDSIEIIEILCNKYDTKFWHPNKEELEQFYDGYSKLSIDEKIKKSRSVPWDFDSWIDAILNAEIILYDLVEYGKKYKISFMQLAYPSGGIEAIENLIKIYDGEIIKNEMI